MVDTSVLIAVMVTLKAKSALNMEHHQLLYEPPGEVVTTKSVIDVGWPRFMSLTTAKPKSGITMNCMAIPSPMAFLLFSCACKDEMSTVADMPNTRQNNRIFPVMSMKRPTSKDIGRAKGGKSL